MKQKVSPEIFRVETKNNSNWKSKYTENKKKEISTFFFKSLEIKNFIKRFSRFHGLACHSCKIALSNTALHLFVSYYTTKYSTLFINRENTKKNCYNNIDDDTTLDATKKLYLEKTSKTIKILVKNYCKSIKTTKVLKKKKKKFYNKLRNFKKKMSFKYFKKRKKISITNKGTFTKKKKIENYVTYSHKFRYFRRQHSYTMRLIKKRLSLRIPAYLERQDQSLNLNASKNQKNLKINSFKKRFLAALTNFIGNKYSIFVTLKHLKVKSIKNFYSKKALIFVKNKLNLQLYKYQNNEFFEIAKRIVFISIKKKNSAQFLANFISSQLNRLKKQQYFFLKCIKQILKALLGNIKKTSTKLFGVRIKVKGRLNKARRANRRTFKFSTGKISLHNINSNIDHAKATSYTSNGTFGTEVWINYKKC